MICVTMYTMYTSMQEVMRILSSMLNTLFEHSVYTKVWCKSGENNTNMDDNIYKAVAISQPGKDKWLKVIKLEYMTNKRDTKVSNFDC